MKRILRSTLVVPASAAGAVIQSDIPQADLETAVPVGGKITPYALVFDPEDSAVTLSRVTIRRVKGSEGAVDVVPDGAASSLAAINKVTSPESDGIDGPSLPISHGARLEVVASNSSASQKTIGVLWKVQNAAMTKGDPRRDKPVHEDPRLKGDARLDKGDNMIDKGDPTFNIKDPFQ